ncbi:hypothetical protein [uncultured Chryseobacterium sp.]|uniref:hypothetical protein n=1 Tax=uncultured Chryseobacterium sp. TaxID=259322 RepID=UPI0025ED3E39|nr:hypothetical protein [uncultured Chryseobacterium sp.]
MGIQGFSNFLITAKCLLLASYFFILNHQNSCFESEPLKAFNSFKGYLFTRHQIYLFFVEIKKLKNDKKSESLGSICIVAGFIFRFLPAKIK